MEGFYDPIMAEIRRIKESHLKDWGSWENFHKHLAEERPILEAQGWHFETAEERNARFARSQAAEELKPL